MATSKVEIYTRAINRLDDPRITSAFDTNPIEFFQIMSGYLDNAIPAFITPSIMLSILQDTTNSSGATELFNGTGLTNTFVLSTTPPTGSYFYGEVNGISEDIAYSQGSNSVSFLTNPPVGTDNVLAQWYYAGQFNQTLTDRQQDILSGLLVQAWSEKEKNFLLDIRRLLQDTDFKLGNESTNINAKGNWFASIREKNDNDMKKYAWDVYNNEMRTQYGLPLIGGV